MVPLGRFGYIFGYQKPQTEALGDTLGAQDIQNGALGCHSGLKMSALAVTGVPVGIPRVPGEAQGIKKYQNWTSFWELF